MASTNSMVESNFISVKPAVEFLNTLDQYSYNEDLVCTFKFNDYIAQEGDRISIFKLGWNFVKDYVVFEWAPTGLNQDQYRVTFNKHILPKNNSEIYQICYISVENELHGASSSFLFTSEKSKKIQPSMMPDINKIAITDTPIDSALLPERDNKIKELKEENKLLKESLKYIVTNKTDKSYEDSIKDIEKAVDNLKTTVHIHQQEIDMLKSKIKEGGEEYRKLYIEKMKLEKKLDKLKPKKDSTDDNFDIEGLKSIPPFPFAK